MVPWLGTLVVCACLLVSQAFSDLPARPRAQSVLEQRWAYLAASAWLMAGLFSSAMGVVQYFGAASAFAPWINQAGLGEAYANLRQRNQFASLTNIALAALIWMAAARSPRESLKPEVIARSRLLWCLAAGLLAVGNAASASRTGLLQLALALALCGVWGLWSKSAVRQVLVASVVIYALAALLLPWLAGFDLSLHGMASRLRSGDQACSSRLTLWSNVVHLIVQKPWLGWGWGELDYAHHMTYYDGPRFCDILDNAHNLPLHFAIELGVPLAVLICGVFVWWVVREQPWREKNSARQLAWSVIALILLHSMLEYPLWYGPFQMAFGMCLWTLWRSSKIQPLSRLATLFLGPWAPKFLAGAFAVSITALAYAAWDYHRISQIFLPPQERSLAYRDDTLNKIRDSWLFRDQVRFAELSLTPLTAENAEWTFRTANALLHYSPEPKVIEKLIDSAVMLKRDDEAAAHLARYKDAFPQEFEKWTRPGSRDARVPQPALP